MVYGWKRVVHQVLVQNTNNNNFKLVEAKFRVTQGEVHGTLQGWTASVITCRLFYHDFRTSRARALGNLPSSRPSLHSPVLSLNFLADVCLENASFTWKFCFSLAFLGFQFNFSVLNWQPIKLKFFSFPSISCLCVQLPFQQNTRHNRNPIQLYLYVFMFQLLYMFFHRYLDFMSLSDSYLYRPGTLKHCCR